ncbi:prolyl oligopeptidase family serine peptidase [Sphingomonas bacterium]|uniref:prolyl oligopeptidase family serine peptidase n=1 Tax=Sphingomonas bacterium TaxID=1895847 RepID=UPI0020C6B190|nr:prolyl oligopeptidase family serine peptidase [Sphingomonas bacterium]
MAVLKRPDLFAAAVIDSGIVNPTRLAAGINGANQFAEMGDPATADGFAALAAQDSTLLLPQVAGGPDFLFTVGFNDARVSPWMSAKLVAAMRAHWGATHLALVRADGQAGHVAGTTREQEIEQRADTFAFLLNRFGQMGFVK